MKCVFKKPTGDKCGLPSLKGKKFCCLHDPSSTSVYLTRDFKQYKRGDILYGISNEEGSSLMTEGVALRIDKLLLARINNNK